MQVVVTIPDEWKEWLEDGSFIIRCVTAYDLAGAIMNGTVLPKDHGRLIDADAFSNSLLHSWHGNNKYLVPYNDRRGYRMRNGEVETCLVNAPTIVSADGK